MVDGGGDLEEAVCREEEEDGGDYEEKRMAAGRHCGGRGEGWRSWGAADCVTGVLLKELRNLGGYRGGCGRRRRVLGVVARNCKERK